MDLNESEKSGIGSTKMVVKKQKAVIMLCRGGGL
jgi:hypothetical protein